MIYFLFASHFAVGCLIALALVPPRVTGGGFPRFISGLVLFFLLSALLAAGVAGHFAGGNFPGALVFYGLASIPIAANALMKGDRFRARAILLASGLSLAAAGFLLDTLASRVPAGAPSSTALVTVGSFLSAGLSAGAVSVAMILGHFYLVIPRLSIRPLVLLCRVLLGALLARIVFGALVFLAWGARSTDLPAADAARFLWQNVAVDEGLIFWPRVFAGLLAPLVLAFMALMTARIRSTQSATGILYVAVVFTTIGEFLGCFLFLSTSLPL